MRVASILFLHEKLKVSFEKSKQSFN
jgi:hypothetical protein